ncbi:MAG: radical SAM protein [Chlorobi bacterium]|nr:radical SAM protein [Chlorobiota bacterium]
MKAKIVDAYVFLKTLTIRKLFNYFVLKSSFYLSLLLKKAVIKGFPASIAIEPTTNCNLQCPECPSGLKQFTRKTGNINIDLYRSVIENAYINLIYLLLYFQGEPFLHPDFFDLIKIAKKKNIYTATSTNAHFLTKKNSRKIIESGLDRIIISIDGATQASYEKYRIGGNLEKVLEGTKNLIEIRKEMKAKKPYVIFQIIVFRSNENEIEKIKNIAKQLGVDSIKIKTAQFYNLDSTNHLIPVNRKFTRYKKQNNSYVVKNKLPNKCWRSWYSSVITIDGTVVPCCFDKDAKHEFGNIKNKALGAIFRNSESGKFKEAILQNRSKIDICNNCTEGLKEFR